MWVHLAMTRGYFSLYSEVKSGKPERLYVCCSSNLDQQYVRQTLPTVLYSSIHFKLF